MSSLSLQADKLSPMMAQWHSCKKSAKNALLFFRMGDFYEVFYEDAVLLAKELDITLTQRQGTPMAGVPHHTIDGYIDKLISRGYRVAIAEQTEDPKLAKGLVKREVVRVVTPGTVVNSSLLAENANNFFAAVTQVGTSFGLAVMDLTTAEFRVAEFEKERDLVNELYRLHPAEVLTSEKFREKFQLLFDDIRLSHSFLLSTQEDWRFDHQIAYDFLASHFKVHSLDGFGLKGMLAAINASGALLAYLVDELCLSIDHIRQISTYSSTEFLLLDRMTQRNLELNESLNDGSRRNTLLGIMDSTSTPMGGRLIRHWVKQPLLSVEKIHRRQDAVEALIQQPFIADRLTEQLKGVRDIERLIMKISTGNASPRDLFAFKTSLEQVPFVKRTLENFSSGLLREECQKLGDFTEIAQLIARALVDDPPMRLSDGGVFRSGFHPPLDELRELSRDGKNWIANYQTRVREETGIKTLKVSFTKAFGYYIEVSKGQSENMPLSFQRRQTLVNAERFISPELKEYETKVLSAEDRIAALEGELFVALRAHVAKESEEVLRSAQALAHIDCLNSLSTIARQFNYVRPLVDDSQIIHIEEGRHPIIEASYLGQKFTPNDTLLDDTENRMFIITGPNMAGKSTYIRQVALMVIMAQMGSFIPAKSARIGLVDKVFTRIGASDDLSRGQSTFMVEMAETANILNNVTERSLVILDEIGRGTSTYDGISIAWSVAEYLLTAEGKTAKTLFATHYWELTKLEEKIPGAVNYNVAIREWQDDVIFLHKIIKGSTDKSYGIHVARLAGLPSPVLMRAKEVLSHLEDNNNRKGLFDFSKMKQAPTKIKTTPSQVQLLLFKDEG